MDTFCFEDGLLYDFTLGILRRQLFTFVMVDDVLFSIFKMILIAILIAMEVKL